MGVSWKAPGFGGRARDLPNGSRESGLDMGLIQGLRNPGWAHSRHSSRGPSVARMNEIQHVLSPAPLQMAFLRRLHCLSPAGAVCLSLMRGLWGLDRSRWTDSRGQELNYQKENRVSSRRKSTDSGVIGT